MTGVGGERGGSLLQEIWAAVDGPPAALESVTLTGDPRVLPAAFDVTGLATASIAAATLAVAEHRATDASIPPVHVDTREASAAFVSEALFTPIGWELPPVWDPVAGVYETTDGWIRLHTNYASHRAAALRALGVPDVPDVVERVRAAVARRGADELETAIVAEGGCAAMMRDASAWRSSAAGKAVWREPLVAARVGAPLSAGVTAEVSRLDADRPLDGVRVLDLTRVIAGPVCTRLLGAYGADVLRIDPPGFEEIPALLPETTVGKRCAALDLRAPDDRRVFESLLNAADVLVVGLRPDALGRLGYDDAWLAAHAPQVVIGRLGAYGWSGPWRTRRGFDSLVQMSSGIAAAGARGGGSAAPVPLPAQALDHGTGYLLAAAVVRALTQRRQDARPRHVHVSLVRTARLLSAHPTDAAHNPGPGWGVDDTIPTSTVWGEARRLPLPGRIDGRRGDWGRSAGRLGSDAAAWLPEG